MPYFAPASNTKTGNGEDLYIPISDVGNNGIIDVIDGNLLVTGSITSGAGVITSGDSGIAEAIVNYKAGTGEAYVAFRPSIPDVLTSVNSTACLSTGPGGNISIVPLTVNGKIKSFADGVVSSLEPNQLKIGTGSGSESTITEGSLSLNNNKLSLTASGSGGGSFGPAGANYVIPNLTVTGTLTANLPQSSVVTATKFQLSTLVQSQTQIPCIPISLGTAFASPVAIRGWGGIYNVQTTQTSPGQMNAYFTNIDLPQIPASANIPQYSFCQLPVMWIATGLGGNPGVNTVPSFTVVAQNTGTPSNPITVWNVVASNVGSNAFTYYPFCLMAIPLVP